ncbi:hypothetical protein SLS56_001160 [Neofusicoccum ribis]|uniref:Deoxyribonuclease NucA/NucB domain-containing protein n=1 Tax=Neofusicoccum ribis TaxID=45134 RepID=A0ABR3TAI6_9PEZI
MKLIKLFQLSALFSMASAIPISGNEDGIPELPDLDDLPSQLLKRGDGKSSGSPKDLIIDLSKNTNAYETFEANCMMILCFGANITLKRDSPNHRKGHYIESGASIKPFTDAEMSKRGVKRKYADAISAEEYPHESTVQGGKGALVIGVSRLSQRSQGQYMKTAYKRYGVDPGDWFTSSYINIPSKSVYCKALMKNPPDTSVCFNKGPTDIVSLTYEKDWDRDGNDPFTFKNLVAGVDKWSPP